MAQTTTSQSSGGGTNYSKNKNMNRQCVRKGMLTTNWCAFIFRISSSIPAKVGSRPDTTSNASSASFHLCAEERKQAKQNQCIPQSTQVPTIRISAKERNVIRGQKQNSQTRNTQSDKATRQREKQTGNRKGQHQCTPSVQPMPDHAEHGLLPSLDSIVCTCQHHQVHCKHQQ